MKALILILSIFLLSCNNKEVEQVGELKVVNISTPDEYGYGTIEFVDEVGNEFYTYDEIKHYK